MNVKGIKVEQIEWDGTLKSLTMQPDSSLGDLWVAFPTDFEEPRTGPFYFQNPAYEKKYVGNVAECQARKISRENFYQMNGIFTYKSSCHNFPTENEALTYYALYLPEYAVPINVNIFDPINHNIKFKRTVIKDNQKPRYIIYLKCSAPSGNFSFDLECAFKKNEDGFTKSTYTDELQTNLYFNPDDWQNLMNRKDKEKTQSFFADQIVINKGNFKQIFKPSNTQEKKKFKLIIQWSMISAIIGFLVFLFGNNMCGRYSGKENTILKSDTTEIISKNRHDTIIAVIELPYSKIVPILDKGIFIKYQFNDFIFGGINIDTISINARTKMGESLKIYKPVGEIQIGISEEPYIEFEYKGTLYSIEMDIKDGSVTSTLRKDIKPTLVLKKYKDLK